MQNNAIIVKVIASSKFTEYKATDLLTLAVNDAGNGNYEFSIKNTEK